jgi:hypothetical protein
MFNIILLEIQHTEVQIYYWDPMAGYDTSQDIVFKKN